ncbi:MAG: ribonuclease P protein component 4 [Euryarchaeota archaeon]|nr:ribonuclease P protein component 4 [Euryarchaeota archaeon]
MAKKRITNREARRIAQARMARLLDLAAIEVREGREERSRRYVTLARSIGMRTKTPMLKDRPYCKKCMIALIPGHNCRIRLRSDRVVVHCLSCGSVRRIPYLREKRGEQNGQEKETGTDRKRQRPQANNTHR